MILGRLRRRKSEVFDREVLQKSRFGIKEYPMLKKVDFGAILKIFGSPFWLKKLPKLVPRGNKKWMQFWDPVFGFYTQRPAECADPF